MESIQIIKALPKQKLYKNVCAYARVSVENDAMQHSLSAQVSYYSNYIQSHDAWIYRGVYSDEAITGTKEERPGFQKMLDDCRSGIIDIILVKSVTRFARNTKVFLETIRELKALDIDVYFEEEGIHLLSMEGEFMLTLFASYAQEEALSVSENMKWRIRKNFERGEMWNKRSILGYKTVDGKYTVEPTQAKLVKHIFDLYLAGNGLDKTAKILNEEGYRTVNGLEWNNNKVRCILTNISYTGDLLLQKTYRLDHLSKKTIINNGQKPQYHIADDHEPIVTKEEFLKVQERLRKRTPKCVSKRKIHEFAGLVKCGICGGAYNHKQNKYKEFWQCRTFDYQGKEKCDSHKVPHIRLIEAVCSILNLEQFDEKEMRKQIKQIVAFNNHKLVFYFNDDREPVEYFWEPESRKWNDEMKERFKQLLKERKNK